MTIVIDTGTSPGLVQEVTSTGGSVEVSNGSGPVVNLETNPIQTVIDNGGQVYNVKAFGAASSLTADNSSPIQTAINTAYAARQGATNSPGAVVFIPAGSWLFNVTVYSGVFLTGPQGGLSSLWRPYNQSLPCVSTPPDIAWVAGGLWNAHMYGYGSGTKVTPYTPITGQGGTPSGRIYNLPLVLSTALTSGAPVTQITVASINNANTVGAGSTIIVNLGGAGQVVTVSTSTALSTTGTTVVPILSFTPTAAYAINTPLMVSGNGFAHGFFAGMGYGNSVNGAVSGMLSCTFGNLLIENFGNNCFHWEGGSVYQTHQFCTAQNVTVQYSDSGVYLFGEIQACDLENVQSQINAWNNWSCIAYLDGATWTYPNKNKYQRCLANQSGFLQNGTAVNATTYGLYNEGAQQIFDTFYFEGNGLGDTTFASAGTRNHFLPTGRAGNVYVNSSWASHFIDYIDSRGDGNSNDRYSFAYNGVTPASAHKTCFVQYVGNSANGGCDSPILGTPTFINAGVVFVLCAGTFAAGKNPIVSSEYGGVGMNPWPTGVVFTNGASIQYASSTPASGTLSSVLLNNITSANTPSGWTCTVGGNPATWQAFGNAQSSAWIIETTFTNSWVSVGGSSAPVAYRLLGDGNHVELAGILGSGTPSNAAFTLPVGFRPITNKTLSSYSTGTGGSRYIQITTAGVVTPEPSGAVAPFSLDGIIFPLDV